jgi:DNA-binding NarL/FixJ family response regulator
VEEACAAIRRVVREAEGRRGPYGGVSRTKVLGPYVEIMLACDDLDAARQGAEELMQLAADSELPFLTATARESLGAVLLAEGEPDTALGSLREAWAAWQKLEAAFESARVQALIGEACRQLGDEVTAEGHLDAARTVFERLGAVPALKALEGDCEREGGGALARLTEREREVLALVASGKTNRQVASSLFISEHTVARHLSNLFDKLEVSSRTEAATVAVRLGLERSGPS